VLKETAVFGTGITGFGRGATRNGLGDGTGLGPCGTGVVGAMEAATGTRTAPLEVKLGAASV